MNRSQMSSIEHRPEANFAFIAIQRLDEKTWQEISERLDGIPIATLGEFYYRWVRQFAPQIRAHLDNNNLDNDPPNNGSF